ncbi:hypothetical protein [Mucilaginibacter pocheonensis]|uniref:Uncharacterized protein n=1 Tax=Mucilaginibacter pocheonensis TaxID=398050 RepID=A0ABU1T6A9_9SPHI|nr:hypothetical protein [Mucilaginibacter pocheonensis]MDR6940908.1 hypothetical protein [Mucilaginibacter pocheonensis]
MKYRIKLADGTTQLIQITTDFYKSWKVWKVQLADGKAAMLFKSGNAWLQRNEDILDNYLLTTIGKCIDEVILGKNRLAL